MPPAALISSIATLAPSVNSAAPAQSLLLPVSSSDHAKSDLRRATLLSERGNRRKGKAQSQRRRNGTPPEQPESLPAVIPERFRSITALPSGGIFSAAPYCQAAFDTSVLQPCGCNHPGAWQTVLTAICPEWPEMLIAATASTRRVKDWRRRRSERRRRSLHCPLRSHWS